MSNNTNENQNTNSTIKPSIIKTNLRGHRPQTAGYQQEDVSDTKISTQLKQTPTVKPSLNVSASVYIPKSVTSNSANTNLNTANTDKNTQPSSLTTNTQTHTLSANTQTFTPKSNNPYNTNINTNAQMNPMGQGYNMNQSTF